MALDNVANLDDFRAENNNHSNKTQEYSMPEVTRVLVSGYHLCAAGIRRITGTGPSFSCRCRSG